MSAAVATIKSPLTSTIDKGISVTTLSAVKVIISTMSFKTRAESAVMLVPLVAV